MPDLEQRIREGLDRLGERPDPARILERVGGRKRHLRLMHRVRVVTLVVVVLAGVGGGMYALTRAFGLGGARQVPDSTFHPSPGASSISGIVLCSDQLTITVESQQGAAGTMSTLWRVTNTAQAPCRSFGYPGMAFHASSGWLNVQVHRGGFPNINRPPASIVVPPDESLFFVSYWNDVTTSSGPCKQFDRVRVTLPDSSAPLEVASAGCLDPLSVDVGPVTLTLPAF